MTGERDQMQPGRPGRGYDPTSRFTDFQWYLYHQHSVAYFGAFSMQTYDAPSLLAFARSLIAAAPQFNDAYRNATAEPSDEILQRIITVKSVPSFEGFPDCWIDDGAPVIDDADLPMFRIRLAQLSEGRDELGRRSFLLVQVSHALTEGSDSSRLSRSHSAAHADPPRHGAAIPLRTALPARIAGLVNGLLHLVTSRMWTPHSGTVRLTSRAFPRQVLQEAARKTGVSQRALFMALVAHTIKNAGTPAAASKISTAYTTLLDGGGTHRDHFMRMRMLYTALVNRPDFPSFARAVESTLKRHESTETGFQSEKNAAFLRFHRWLSGIAPFLYSPKFFAFWPYDVVFSLLTPHQMAGALTKGLLEPIYCGTTIPGVNGCIVVPGREWVTFNFFVEEHLLPQVDRLASAIGDLSGGSADKLAHKARGGIDIGQPPASPVTPAPAAARAG